MAELQEPTNNVRFAGLETIPLEVVVHVGTATMLLERLQELQPGEIVPLDRKIGEAFDLRAGEVILAKVEPVGYEDGVAVKVVDIPQEESAHGGE